MKKGAGGGHTNLGGTTLMWLLYWVMKERAEPQEETFQPSWIFSSISPQDRWAEPKREGVVQEGLKVEPLLLSH